MSINSVVLVGRLTKDPELTYLPSGIALAKFTLAVNRQFANKQGEREADFLQIIVFNKPAENTGKYLKKGSLAGIEGRIQSRSYEQDGKRRYVTEIVASSVQFLEPKRSNNQNNDHNAPNYGNYDGTPVDVQDDDIPFI